MIDHVKSMHAENAELSAKLRQAEADLDALKAALQEIAKQLKVGESDGPDEDADFDHAYHTIIDVARKALGAKPQVNYQDYGENTNKINEKPVAPKSAERRCELCQHYDAMQRPGKGFCTVNKEHWPTVEASFCCEKFETRGDAA